MEKNKKPFDPFGTVSVDHKSGRPQPYTLRPDRQFVRFEATPWHHSLKATLIETQLPDANGHIREAGWAYVDHLIKDRPNEAGPRLARFAPLLRAIATMGPDYINDSLDHPSDRQAAEEALAWINSKTRVPNG